MAARKFTAWQYTSDEGVTYRTRVANYINTQLDGSSAAKIGGQQAVADDGQKPKSLSMRAALVYESGGTFRRVPCMSTTCDLWTNKDATIQLNMGQPAVLTTFHRYGLEGERDRHERTIATA